MEQEIRRPDYVPRKHDRTSSLLNCFIAAAGVTLMTACLVGSAVAAGVWAFGSLFALSETAVLVLVIVAMIPVLLFTVWTAGRAWHVEQLLAQGKDVDMPVFKIAHYFRKAP